MLSRAGLPAVSTAPRRLRRRCRRRACGARTAFASRLPTARAPPSDGRPRTRSGQLRTRSPSPCGRRPRQRLGPDLALGRDRGNTIRTSASRCRPRWLPAPRSGCPSPATGPRPTRRPRSPCRSRCRGRRSARCRGRSPPCGRNCPARSRPELRRPEPRPRAVPAGRRLPPAAVVEPEPPRTGQHDASIRPAAPGVQGAGPGPPPLSAPGPGACPPAPCGRRDQARHPEYGHPRQVGCSRGMSGRCEMVAIRRNCEG